MYEQALAFIQEHNLIPPASTIILGLSGGPDSLFLLHLLAPLHQAGTITLIAAHLDHEWRNESYKDVEFCQVATSHLGIPFVSQKISELGLSLKSNGSQEELGRKARRHFFEQLRLRHNAHAIALAHHADDQQETFFIRLMRGASLTGLTGMKPRHGWYIRPLLNCYKKDIIAYLDTHAIVYLVDPSNSSNNYLRNRIRSHVVPALHNSDQRFSANFMRTLDQLQKTEDFLEQHTKSTFEQISHTAEDMYALDQTAFLSLDPIMQQRILLHWFYVTKAPFIPSQAGFEEILRFIKTSKKNSHAMHPQWKLCKKKNLLSVLCREKTIL